MSPLKTAMVSILTDWLNTIYFDKLFKIYTGTDLWRNANQEIKKISFLIQMYTMVSQNVKIRETEDVIDLILWIPIILDFSKKLLYWIIEIFPCFDQKSSRRPRFTNFTKPNISIVHFCGTTRKVHTLHNKYIYVHGPWMMKILINFLSTLLIENRDLPTPPIILLCLEGPSAITVLLWLNKYP